MDLPGSYEGDTGPQHWGDLSPDFVPCGAGCRQSPIDLPDASPAGATLPTFRYEACTLDVVNNGRSIQQDVAGGGGITIDGERHDLVQFHFHAPAEHTVAGRRLDMEAHLVHRGAAGGIAVVGVLLHEGDENAFLRPLWERMPSRPGERVADAGIGLDVTGLLPADRACWTYEGSLTTPPCTEDVRWFVFRQPVSLSAGQLRTFRALYDGNARPVQPLNDRVVRRAGP
jgi:carbonic anhydrase